MSLVAVMTSTPGTEISLATCSTTLVPSSPLRSRDAGSFCDADSLWHGQSTGGQRSTQKQQRLRSPQIMGGLGGVITIKPHQETTWPKSSSRWSSEMHLWPPNAPKTAAMQRKRKSETAARGTHTCAAIQRRLHEEKKVRREPGGGDGSRSMRRHGDALWSVRRSVLGDPARSYSQIRQAQR